MPLSSSARSPRRSSPRGGSAGGPGGAARRLGGSSRAVALVAAAAVPQLAQDWQLRAQSFAYVLFVAVLALLVADQRRASSRVLWCLPLLVLWANLHGSVAVGALLVAVRG